MATATKHSEIARVEKVVVQPEKVVLDLSPEEAQFLVDVLASIGGHPETTRRGTGDSVRAALKSVGFDFKEYNSPGRDWSGNIQFRDRLTGQ